MESVEAFVEFVKKWLGSNKLDRIDYLFNNAGLLGTKYSKTK